MPYADLLLTDAAIFTGDPARPRARALAVWGGVVLGVTTDPADLREHVGPATAVLSLGGRTVLPGFQDAHVHAPFAGRYGLHVSLHDLPGVRAYVDAVARYAQAHPDEPWIFGGGWAMEHFPGGAPSKDLLDAVVPDRPVILFNRDVHSAWLNSRALEIGHITAETKDPWDGRIERDPVTGEPTGTLHEGAAYSFADAYLPEPDLAEWERATLDAQRHLHSLGVTGWQDAWVTPHTEAAYRSLAGRGELTARVVGALWWDRHRGLDQVGELAERRARGSVGNFHPTAVKIMTDGVLETFTGALLRPYCDAHGHETDNRGFSYVDAEELSQALVALDAARFQVHMHAIGDRAVRNALDACEAAIAANGRRDSRHHIAHLQLVQPDDVPRFGALGVVANCQPYWAQMEPQMAELTLPFLGAERAQRQYLFADLYRTGARLAFGSDWSVTTPNPLEELEVAVTRVGPEHRGSDPFLPDQRLPLEVALEAFTAGSAYVNFDADGGSLRPGARADLAVLDRDLFDPGAGPLGDAKVDFTFAAGRCVFERG